MEPHELRLSRENALDVIAGYDVVVDGSDNFPTRYLVNDACVLLGRPYVYGRRPVSSPPAPKAACWACCRA